MLIMFTDSSRWLTLNIRIAVLKSPVVQACKMSPSKKLTRWRTKITVYSSQAPLFPML